MRVLLKINLLLIITCMCGYNMYAQTNYWQQQADFTITVKLNDIEHTLDGFETIHYANHSRDTLKFIWFHLWPNAYKNDKTAFSDQLLTNGDTRFYFSSKQDRGYINRLVFKADGLTAETEDHPQFIDVVKVILPIPLAPGKSTEITTPFHVQLPKNVSRGGHIGHTYQVTQWFPKPAVYDKKGWHEMPYLDQGEFYSEFGNYDVSITVPADYVVAATGDLQNEEEIKWLKERVAKYELKSEKSTVATAPKKTVVNKNKAPQKKQPAKKTVTANKTAASKGKSSDDDLDAAAFKNQGPTKTLRYVQNNVIDFAWFADKNFIVNTDTLQLPSGRVINTWAFYEKRQATYWKNSIAFIKNSAIKHSQWLGEYPFNNVTAIQANAPTGGGMEYPTITLISDVSSAEILDITIFHEVGHNWLQGILATNERDYAWMDEGMNTYYDNRYDELKQDNSDNGFFDKKMPGHAIHTLVESMEGIKQDQPINTTSTKFTELNYGLIAYYKTGEWMKWLQGKLGKPLFDSCMQAYYKQWSFKHPQPGDFKTVMEQTSGQKLDTIFQKLDEKGPLEKPIAHKKIVPTFLFNLRDTDKKQYISIMPAVGFNDYDHFMVGAFIHNYQLPLPRLQFFLAPLYATNTKTLTGLGRVGYNWYQPSEKIRKIELALSGAKFSTRDGVDSNGTKIFSGFYKLAPSLRIDFANRSPLNTMRKWVEWKTYFIGENNFRYKQYSVDSTYYPVQGKYTTTYINQLSFVAENDRILYPYSGRLQVQQGSSFWKATFTGNYFFNYAKGGGANIRLFAAKFGYIGSSNSQKQFDNYRYMPKLTAVGGNDDYTYSNYFIGRNETDGIASQQVMMRDGDLKILHTEQFSSLPNRSDNWVAAINLNTSLPYQIIPKWIPIKLFFDLGTTAEAWNKNNTGADISRILYVGGIQLSLLKNTINIYAPLVYSKDFKDELKTDPATNTFGKRISFSIDLQNITLRKISGQNIPL